MHLFGTLLHARTAERWPNDSNVVRFMLLTVFVERDPINLGIAYALVRSGLAINYDSIGVGRAQRCDQENIGLSGSAQVGCFESDRSECGRNSPLKFDRGRGQIGSSAES